MDLIERVATLIVTSPVTPAIGFLLGWFAGGTLLDLALRRLSVRAAPFVVAALGATLFATVGVWFGWARYRLWHRDDWTDPHRTFPYPDAFLLAWYDALSAPPPPGTLDIGLAVYLVDLRLFALITACWFFVGAFVGAALPPRSALAGVPRRTKSE